MRNDVGPYDDWKPGGRYWHMATKPVLGRTDIKEGIGERLGDALVQVSLALADLTIDATRNPPYDRINVEAAARRMQGALANIIQVVAEVAGVQPDLSFWDEQNRKGSA